MKGNLSIFISFGVNQGDLKLYVGFHPENDIKDSNENIQSIMFELKNYVEEISELIIEVIKNKYQLDPEETNSNIVWIDLGDD